MEHKRISINGKKDTFKNWAKRYKLPEVVLRARHASGLTGKDLTRKVNNKNKVVNFMGRKGTIKELAKRFKVDYHTMWCAVRVVNKVKN